MILKDKIHLLKIDFEITLSPEKKIPRSVNIILILGEKITLVDTGVKDCEGLISNYLESQGRKLSEIESVILSHSHPDHIGSAVAIKDATNCSILAHKLEKEWIEDINLQAKERPVPGFFNLVDSSVKIDKIIGDYEEIIVEPGVTLRLFKSSGHSKGSMNILFVEDRILFTADSIPLKNDIPNYDNYIDLRQSLERIKNSSDYNILLTSWTPPLVEKDKINALIAEGEEYMNRIDSAVKKNYKDNVADSLIHCKSVVEALSLPPFLVNPIVDKAFRSHLI